MKQKEESINQRIKNGPLAKIWEKIGIKHHHGLSIPLFSLHSKKSCGIGEFLDLKLLIDFCSHVSMDVIQLLPLNDTGYETSPYNAVSSQALNPIYISLHDLPFIQSDKELQLDLVKFRRYNYLQRVAYNAVLTSKLEFLKNYYNKYFESFKKTAPYEAFIKDHKWLTDYGLFKCLKEQYAHKGWFSWRPQHQKLSTNHRKELIKEFSQDIDFYIFLQFLAFTQLEEVKSYADKKGVFIKGDIPILISPESLDVWHGAQNFDLDFAAGAPPDMFTADGQYWGFPIYNWAHIEQTNYEFWRERLKTSSLFYHIFRIDHIIGLYRIWAIERGDKAINGTFIPEDPSLAIMQGEKILSKLISFTDMMPIGEDLAQDIEHIRRSLARQTICGTKIPRWERDHEGDKHFIPYDEFNPFSLTTVSTHDSETLTLWWEKYTEEVKDFCAAHNMIYTKTLTRELRLQMLKDSHNNASLFHVNPFQEYLALFENLIWDNPHDERINLPGTILPSNWCYKLRPSLEHLLSHHDLKETLREFASGGQRIIDPLKTQG